MDEPPEPVDKQRWEKLANRDMLGRGGRVRSLPRRPSSNEDMQPRVSATFADNLRALAHLAKVTPDEVVEKCRISGRWYTRLMANGLARIDKRTRPGLERLAHFFDLGRVEDFWDPRMDRRRQRAGAEEQIITWSTKVNWSYAKKLLELLETGEHEHLKGLIDTLHSLESLKMIQGAGAASGRSRPEDADASGTLRQRIKRRPR